MRAKVLSLSESVHDHPGIRGMDRTEFLRYAAAEASRYLRTTPQESAEDIGSFRSFVSRLRPRFRWYRHVEIAVEVLQAVADGELDRVMFFWPPRHGKTELYGRLFPAYYLRRTPDRFVGLATYAAELSFVISRTARDVFELDGGLVRSDAGAVRHWETESGGGFWASGVGGPITGKGFNLGVIDDPIKNAEEAGSETIRSKQWDWYQSTWSTRREPGAAEILGQTRWHQQDLAGKILEQEELEPERWHVVNFEAIKEDGPAVFPVTCTVEKDFRKPGQALCPERYPLDKLKSIAKRIGSYFWNALYQQRPRPREGGTFKRGWFEIVDAVPPLVAQVRYWDHGSTEGGGDPTAGCRMAKARDGTFIILDMVRGQWSSGQRDKEILVTASLDTPTVEIWGQQEPGSSGKDQALAFRKMLAGYTVHTEPASGSKELRADPFAAAAEAGLVTLLRGKWNAAFLDEAVDFPRGAHDDQVETASGAFNKLALRGEKPRIQPTVSQRSLR